MYQVKNFIEKSSRAPLASLVKNEKPEDKNFKIKTITFNSAETELIDSNAKKNESPLGANIFLIAACAHIVNNINIKRNMSGKTLWIPVPYDGRKRGGFGPVVTNCISFLFYRIPVSELSSIKQTVRCIKEQMTEQIKMDMPRKYNILLDMMRYIPLNLYSFITTRSSKGVVASFLFSSAGQDIWDMNTLMDKPLDDILVIPPFTFPPGLMFSFLRYNNNLKVNIVYSESTINTEEFESISTNIKKHLLANY